MNSIIKENPFIVSGYPGASLFCDRDHETQQLILNAQNGINTTLLSVRRMGKTGLLHHTMEKLKQQRAGHGIYIDIYDTENIRDFTNRIATIVYNTFPPKKSPWTAAREFITSLRPVLSYDSMEGTPQVMLDFKTTKHYEQSLEAILQFLDKQKTLIVIALDEFQQIATYPEKNVEATLRTVIQRLKHVRFIFSGSSPHLLSEMFTSTKHPFFSSTQSLFLHEIESPVYARFIKRMFKRFSRTIDDEAIDFILEFTRCHTYYTQMLCNRIFTQPKISIGLDEARAAALEILLLNESVFYQYRNLLTAQQWALLRAIALEGDAEKPGSSRFLSRHELGAASSVKRSLESLLQKEMVYAKNQGGNRVYRVYDCFLERWFEWKAKLIG